VAPFLLSCRPMRYLASLSLLLMLASGCSLVFDDGGDDAVCLAGAEPAALPAPQRNPDSLTCESFGGGGCLPECGPCPALDLAPIPTWGFCGSACESLSESACAQDAGCRVVKNAACVASGTCATDFLGCFPTDQGTDPALDCFSATDGYTCSRSAACTAYHRVAAGVDPTAPREFAMCVPEGKAPGTCFGQVICTRAAPQCPAQSTPAVASGCYTGGCIPLDLCEARTK
jgi:hypothetical protein